MATNNSGATVYTVSSGNIAIEEGGSNTTDGYTSIGNRDRNQYDTLENTFTTISLRNSLDEDYATIEDHNHDRSKVNGPLKFRNRKCIYVLTTVVALLVVAVVVLVILFVSSRSEENVDESKQCPKYLHVNNGKIVQSTGSNHGDFTIIECDDRSKLIGANLITCLPSGQWNDTPECIPKGCGDFVLEDNMLTNSEATDSDVGTEIYLTCKEGFEIHGDDTVTCQMNESWSERPLCIEVDCGVPLNISNAEIVDLNSTTYNNTFSVRCKEGHVLVGSESVRCNESGHWNQLPTCNSTSCGIPDLPSHAHISYVTWASAIIECEEGFVLIGSSVINCQANGFWTPLPTCSSNSSDCFNIANTQSSPSSGIYDVQLWQSNRTLRAYCDMETDQGGWTVFQYRYNGSVDFYRDFNDYENGFGDIETEFWLGLSYIQEIAAQGESDLRIDLEAADGARAFETFTNFYLSEGPDYTLHVGDTIDSINISEIYRFGPYHNGSKFSTYDRDVDAAIGNNCARTFRGGWWYKTCHYANLNGEYITPGIHNDRGMTYQSFQYFPSMKSSKMMIRRKRGG